ncbi:hypothetical protein [Campylobacter hyointestinalis]|uniref:Flagellar hook-length control protein FliK n=1 Tax=Campylobacter hyointestinalis subsp. lawsonii TaxID=91353 RepID=A0AAV6EG25_CAMHY|nr:hypothetical protein [Campylobacter hyointestinalis]KAB0614097.1 hypothetical protein F7P66_00385 [Campylobacter hyointestinalis subsp. lawsonii]QKF69834.1 hypothetical protein CHLWT_1282 [Campylobacter hyointestinalis subsp. lawsonii]RAZ29805.1 hypothetical protein CHLT_00080 [Campylobacter hyointestinalis subsp. lawsonii]
MIITNNNSTPNTQINQKDEKKDLSSPKTIFKKDSTHSTELSEVDVKLNQITNKLLDQLKANNDGNFKPQVLNQAKNAQVAPNFAKDVVDLINSIKSDPNLSKFATKLEEFLKPIEQIKNADLASNIKNSGIMLEAKISEALRKESLPTSIKELLSLMKKVQSNELKQSFLELAKNENSDIQKSFDDLKLILENAKAKNLNVINNSNLKPLLNLGKSIENAIKFLDKSANLLSEQATQNLNKTNTSQNIQTKISSTIKALDFVQNLLQKTQSQVEKINFELPNLKNIKSIKNDLINITNDINKQINTLKDSFGIAKTNTLSNLMSLEQSSTLIENLIDAISTDANNTNLQEKLSLAAKKLSNIINYFDKNAGDAKQNLAQINHLSKLAKKATLDIQNIEPNNIDESLKALSNDVKTTLLNLKEATQNASNLNNINQNVNRLLTQIEMHQLMSFAGNSIQTYLPYVWDGLDSSSVAFKQGKSKFYAKIDLNFIKYGSVSVILGLFDGKFIDIMISTGKEDFKDIILNSSKELKTAITNLGLIISSFSLTHKAKFEPYNEQNSFDLGFNVKA